MARDALPSLQAAMVNATARLKAKAAVYSASSEEDRTSSQTPCQRLASTHFHREDGGTRQPGSHNFLKVHC